MVNHIEQMMKVAGVKQKFRYIVLFFNNEYEARREDMPIYFKALKKGDIKVKRVIKYYPPFTPAKQLELIKLICKSRNICELSIHLVPYGAGEDFWFQKVTYFKEQKCYMDKEPVLVAASKFENVLAELTIELIKSNELDKAEVKRILEDE